MQRGHGRLEQRRADSPRVDAGVGCAESGGEQLAETDGTAGGPRDADSLYTGVTDRNEPHRHAIGIVEIDRPRDVRCRDGEAAEACVVLGQGLARSIEFENGAPESEPVLVDAAADLQELFVGKTDRTLIERAACVDVRQKARRQGEASPVARGLPGSLRTCRCSSVVNVWI